MTTELQKVIAPQNQDQLDRTIECLKALPSRQELTQEGLVRAEGLVAAISQPADKPKLLAMLAGLFSHYYVADLPDTMQQSIASDYCVELGKYPLWVVGKSKRWWLSSENPNRRKKPLPGDLAEECKFHFKTVQQWQSWLSQPTELQHIPKAKAKTDDRAKVVKGFTSLRAALKGSKSWQDAEAEWRAGK